MKTRIFAAALLLVCCGIWTYAAEDYVRESGWAGETFTSKVIKDLSFRDDGAEYTAYLVRWKDHEVVVTAPLPLEQKYVVGESIRCQMMRHDGRLAGEVGSQMTFLIFAAATNDARLKAIADEVAARRALRDKALTEKQGAKKP